MAVILEDVDDLDLTRWIRSGDGLVWGQGCAEPVALTQRLMSQASQLGSITAFIGATFAGILEPAATPELALSSYCASGRNREWRASGLLEVLPLHYSALPGLFRRRTIPSDVVFLLLGPADEHGRYPLGLADEYLSAALETARVVIAEVSSRVPRVPHSRILAAEDIDVVVLTDRDPVELPANESADNFDLAAQVAALVPDGATLQIGLGSFPGAVLSCLSEHNDLGVHSGLITDGVAELAQRGVITNAAKARDSGLTVTGIAMGSRSLFDWLDDNRSVALRDTGYTHAAEVLGSLPRFTAINAALEVDLTGQANTEVAGGRYIGAVGGILDFLRGAARSVGGLPILALPAASRGRSRIVPALSGPATVGRADAAVVVTEFGAVDLRGLSLPARREALISIADPAFRAELAASAAADLGGA